MDQRLYNSAKSGHTLLFKQLLNENPNLLLKLTPHENTPLHIPARFGHKNIVAEIYNQQQCLLAQPNLDGDTPLHVAARAGCISIVSFLVEKMLSSSYIVIEKRENRGVEILMRMRNKWGNTVLHEALRSHGVRVAEFFIKVDPGLACLENNTGESPLYLAATDGMIKNVNHILMKARSSAYGGPDGQTALHAAVAEGHFDGQSPLHVAAYRGHTNVIKEIVRCCPDSGELLDLQGQNAPHVAVLGEKLSVVRHILKTTELEGLINQTDDDGNTPLHLATRESKSWMAHYLLWDERVDQRAKNNIGQTTIGKESSIRMSYSRFPKTSRIWGQPWFMNTWINREKIPQSISEEARAAAADKLETYKQIGQTLLMVATLIAMVTFAAAFKIPGNFDNNVGPGQGLALSQSSINVKWFVVSDSITMSCSVVAACILIWGAVIAKKT